MKTCTCGSGNPRYPLRDAAGIFCAYVCESCEDAKAARFNPAIFSGNAVYAATGDESALEVDTNYEGY